MNSVEEMITNCMMRWRGRISGRTLLPKPKHGHCADIVYINWFRPMKFVMEQVVYEELRQKH